MGLFYFQENFHLLEQKQFDKNWSVKINYDLHKLISYNQLRLIQKEMIENPITLEQQRKVWSIHQSVNGVTYYYNRATKKSQYEMPECFKTTQQQTEHPEWKQYRTAEGKKFYYNALTRKSSWQLPNEVKQYKRKLEQQKKKQRQLNGGVEVEQKLSEEEEKKKKLTALFKAKSINVNTKWQSCIKMCEDDERWTLMKISDKKKIFNDYINDLKKLNEMEKKAKTEINKGQFIKMLKEAKFLNSDSKMHKVAYDFMTDPRWKILDEIDKQNTFQDYIDELWNKQKEKQKENKQKNMDNLRLLMENENVKYNLKWDDFRSKFRNFETYKNLHPYDRISVFIEYIMDAQKKHEQETLKQKRLRERYNRINYRNLLKEKLLSGQLGYKTKWRQFVNDNKDDKNLLNMMDPQQQGSTAHQIFETFMFQIRNNHKVLKNEIKQHFKKKQFKMTEETTIEEFQDKLCDLQEYTTQKDYVRQYIYKYFVQKIKSKNQNKQLSAKKALKKEKKLIFKIFKQLKDNLKTKYSIEDHMEKIQKGMKQNGITISHQSIFKYYLAFLEGYDEDKKKKQDSRSKSSDRSSVSSAKPKKRAKPETQEQTNGGNLKKFNIPAELKNSMLNDMEEQGQIKDDQVQQDKKEKKKKSHKKKRRASSSDSD